MGVGGLSRCPYALGLALCLDVVGLLSLLVGVFGKLQRGGRDYGDLLIYSGAIVLFLSLIGWVFWYTGNIEISWRELSTDYAPAEARLHRLVRTLSRRLSRRSSWPHWGRAQERGTKGVGRDALGEEP